MHFPAAGLPRALTIVAASLILLGVVPAPPVAAADWGAALVQGCDWAGADPAICSSLVVHSNGSDFGYYDGDSGYGLQWQCVELAQRWTNLAYGETYRGGTHWGVNAAYEMWRVWTPGNVDQANYTVPFAQEPNGGSSAPQFGDLVIWAPAPGNPYGHVSVVSGTEVGYVDIVEENWSDSVGAVRVPITGTTLADRGNYHAYGWLRAGNAHNLRSLGRTPAHNWSGLLSSGKVRVGLLRSDQSLAVVDGGGAAYSSAVGIGDGLLSAPTAVQDSAGLLEFFATRADHAVGRYSTPKGANSPVWSSLGGTIPGKPTVTRAPDGHLEVFVRGTDNGIWRDYQLTPGGSWSGWNSIGGVVASDPAVVITPDNRIALYVIATDKALWQWAQAPAQPYAWSSLGGVSAGAPQVVMGAAGQVDVYLVGTDNQVWHRAGVPSGVLSGWACLGGVVVGDPTVTLSRAGLPVVLVVGSDGGLWINRRSAAAWSGWSSPGGYLYSDVSAQRDSSGLLEIFGLGGGNVLYHIIETTPDGPLGSWSGLGGSWQVP